MIENLTYAKKVAESVNQNAVDFLFRVKEALTEDATATVVKEIEVPDNSKGFLEVWFSGACYDGSALDGIAGIKRIGFKKEAGAISILSTDSVFSMASGSVMAASSLSVGGTDKIEISVTGAAAIEVQWNLEGKIIYSTTQILAP